MLSEIYKQNKRLKELAFILFIGVVLFSILIMLTVRIPGSDDTIFQQMIAPYPSVIDWVSYRYQNWSGRIFAESFVYIFSSIPLFFWQAVSIIFYAIFTAIIFMYYRLFDDNHNKQKDTIMLILAFCLPFLINTDVLRSGMFWVTGSMNYFWIATLGLVGFYPIAYYASNHRIPHRIVTILGTVSLIIAACSQEQVGLILTGLSFILLVRELYLYRNKISPLLIYPIIITTVTAISFFISFLAPGNTIRIKLETLHWLPDFYTIGLSQHIEYAYRWFLDSTINHTGFLLALSWALMALILMKKPNKTKLQNIFTYSLIIFCFAVPILNAYGPINNLFSFYATWKPGHLGVLSYTVLTAWTVVIVGTIIAPLIAFDRKNIGRMVSILYLTAFTSIGIITISPTVYASGLRTLFIPSVILVLITYIIASETIDKYAKYKYIITYIIACLALIGYLYTALRLIHGLNP